MKIDSPLFGKLEISDDRIIEFPKGLPGFESCHKFSLMHEDGGEHKIFQLQSAEQPHIIFSISPTQELGVNFEFTLSNEEVATLDLKDPQDLAIALILRRRETSDAPTETGLKANYMAPIIINTASRKALQKIISRYEFDLTIRESAGT